MKTCRKCGIDKPFSDYYKSGKYMRSWCKECDLAYQRSYYAENPERVKARASNWRKRYSKEYSKRRKELRKKYYAAELARKHKVPKSQIESMLANRGDNCHACGKVFEAVGKHRRNLDHCHKTNVIRGFLCTRCNTILGLCDESATVLNNIKKYMSKHAER